MTFTMRKSLLFFFLFLSTVLNAQQRVVIAQANGDTLYIPIWQIDNISFENVQLPTPSKPETVDLGLKSGLLWGSWNVGAESAEQVGYLLGWGNADSTNLSKDAKYFPLPNFTRNITNTDYDIAKAFWASEENPFWHMPTVEDFQELAACQWEWVAEKRAYKISNPNADDESLRENFIYLPVTGERFGEEEPDSVDFGFYWTGYKGSADSTAVYVRISIVDGEVVVEPTGDETSGGEEQGDGAETGDGGEPGTGGGGEAVVPTFWSIQDGFRARHMAVRPVYGEYKIPVSITSSDAELEHLNASIMTRVEGEGENIKFYIAYSNVENFVVAEAKKSAVYLIENLEELFSERIQLTGLDYDTKYYYRAVAIVGDNTVEEAVTHMFQTEPDTRIVNLGLSVKWASRNIGADSEEESGYHVPWGSLTENGYPYGGSNHISGFADYDLATAVWGGEWRMPTREEFEELKRYCTATQEKVNGVSGVRFSRNHTSIFLPFAGGRAGSSIQNAGKVGYYWTDEGSTGVAYVLDLQSPIYDDFFTMELSTKSLGLSVRAVYGKNDKNNFIENPDEGGDEPGGDTPGGDTPGGDEPGGDTPGGEEPPVNPIAEDVEAIDLGLTSGTLWANKNVGSVNSSEYGEFYAWGETETKSTYLLSNYSHYNADFETFDSPYKGVKGIQGTEQDAAHVIWGGNWVIPTPTQFSELVEQCTWEWQNDYNSTGVKGYIVKSKKNSNYIFLPITGYYNGASRTAQNRGFYWTSSLYLFPADWDKAKQAMEFVIELSDNENDMHYQMDTSRACGLAIRPVKNK
jgi:hypothetical protein